MKNTNLNPLAISLSIVAIALSIFATYMANGFDFINPEKEKTPTEAAGVSDEFKDQVYAVIDQYIKEQQGYTEPTGPVDISIDGSPAQGDEDAPVTLVEYSDFECPYCERYFIETYPQIVENYVKTGKVKYVFKDFPLPIHSNAVPAANAARCIQEQGGDEMFFKYHDILFQNQGGLSVENYKLWAKDFDIDQNEFASCVDENKFEGEIAAEMAEGQSFGVQGTPTFFVNGVMIQPSGAQPYALFEQAIEAALSEE